MAEDLFSFFNRKMFKWPKIFSVHSSTEKMVAHLHIELSGHDHVLAGKILTICKQQKIIQWKPLNVITLNVIKLTRFA
jgi:hypothetical protein